MTHNPATNAQASLPLRSCSSAIRTSFRSRQARDTASSGAGGGVSSGSGRPNPRRGGGGLPWLVSTCTTHHTSVTNHDNAANANTRRSSKYAAGVRRLYSGCMLQRNALKASQDLPSQNPLCCRCMPAYMEQDARTSAAERRRVLSGTGRENSLRPSKASIRGGDERGAVSKPWQPRSRGETGWVSRSPGQHQTPACSHGASRQRQAHAVHQSSLAFSDRGT